MSMKNTNIGWSSIEMAGIFVIALGAAFLAYSAYSYFSVPAIGTTHIFNTTGAPAGGNFPGGGGGGGGNFTRTGDFNRTAFTGTIGGTFGTPIIERIGDMLSGIIAVLLGVVLFKYGGLRKQVASR